MSEEHVKGSFEKAGGRVKEAVGALVGNERLKSEGQFDQLKGEADEAWGDVKDAAKGLAAHLRHATDKTESTIDRDTAVPKDPLV